MMFTSDFKLSSDSYKIYDRDDRVELNIQCAGLTKQDIQIKTRPYKRRGCNSKLYVTLPDTPFSNSREFLFVVGEDYKIKDIKANVRDGILYIHIPKENTLSNVQIE